MKTFRAAAAILASFPGLCCAGVIDMTQPMTTQVLNDAILQTSDFAGAGTGSLRPFVRMKADGVEQGYNTSGRPVAFNETTSGNFTHDLRIGDVGVRTVGGQPYLEFWLDINQSNSGAASRLSLDRLQIYTSTIGGQTTSNVSSLGIPRYDLDAGADNWVEMDGALASGSGYGDVKLLVPLAAFGNASTTDYIYLYSQFGGNSPSNGGFEEWAIQVPTPGTAALSAVALAPLCRRRRR